jgi:hypothetical protein
MVIIMTIERELLNEVLEYFDPLGLNTEHCGDLPERIKELLAQPEQTEQEPVATKLESHQFTAFHVSADDFKKLQKLPTGTKIYTAPPKREPLSDDEMRAIWKEGIRGEIPFVEIGRAIEKVHGIGVDYE